MRPLFEAKLASHEKTLYKLIFHAAAPPSQNLQFENKAQTSTEVGLENGPGPLGLEFFKWPEGCIFYSSYLEHQINNSAERTTSMFASQVCHLLLLVRDTKCRKKPSSV